MRENCLSGGNGGSALATGSFHLLLPNTKSEREYALTVEPPEIDTEPVNGFETLATKV